ncbi:MAG: undecaprenyl/decaprenyl-phosphate alpha-N-acetylglucosaminyl 1-phosphate transferase [Actinobacteria bacterium]|nr:undecaprenyl/decaprenyl-phosphate alpha-N-acetylglucosaminyl 1-phosphate transferase [Actinomycetota bacterium]MBU1943305.1 undecaprenyl/decaprenyl-phosphate alpha-N-acetylglucosaminyl 1-phosphate transferase [Actinomycetota bacterium]MBU2686577.1 undecaprenyl/decaprenyl-phosphate alpha-N-acetylglucosaminyl 1-phosphate transferase [Actinomycetota bacterium]
MNSYFLAFSAALVGALVLTPAARWLALRVNALDVPEDRKVHEKVTPTLGGLAIYAAMMLGISIYVVFGSRQVSADILGIVIGATIILIFGALDDIHGMSPLAKLFGQVLAAGVLVVMGVQIQNLHIPGGGVLSLSPELSVLVSLLWVVAFMNIINLIDGLDGLAAGITCITAFSMFIYATQTGVGGAFVDAALISIVMAGATLGFLRYNFNPASIFMGDSGSMLLGFLLGAVTIQGVLKSIAAAALVVPLMALAIPIIDTGMAIARRLRKGISITHADKEHIHHRLLNMGHSQRQAVLLLYFWTALLCGTSLALKFMANNKFLWITLALAIGGFVITALPPIIRGENGRRGKHRARRKPAVQSAIPVESGEIEEG